MSLVATPARREPPNYRPDIDGLRALAVMAVIGFHAEIRALRGGFVGVDVFFVVSGYLISGLIFRALDRGTFSCAEFYTRRINRIFPSLIVVLIATAAVGRAILFQEEFETLGKHIVGGSTFVSNFILQRELSYFYLPNKPLLHLWSLAVEEQFYIAWPLVAVIAWKRRWNPTLLLGSIIAVSFALNVLGVSYDHAKSAFYYPVTRFWEILAGAFIANAELRRPDWNRLRRVFTPAIRQLAAVVGLFLLVAAVYFTNTTTPWPGWAASVPVAATMLLIVAGKDTWINQHILGNRALVGVGLVSYPLYLWHWPIMIYSKLATDHPPPSERARVAMVVASFILAVATYRWVEIPIRFGARKRRSAALLLTGLSLVGVLGFLIWRGEVRPRLANSFTGSLQEALRDWDYPGGGFSHLGREPVVNPIRGDDSRTVIFYGDSHAEQYWPRAVELAQLSRASSPTVLFITHGGCAPLPLVERIGKAWDGSDYRCDKFYDMVRKRMADEKVRTVVIAAYWETYLTENLMYLTTDPMRRPLTPLDPNTTIALRLLERDVANLTRSGKRVFILLSNPAAYPYDPASILPGRLSIGRTPRHPKVVLKADILARTSVVSSLLRAIAERTGAVVIDPVSSLCGEVTCPTLDESGAPIYKDSHHLRASFARRNATFIDPALR